MGEVEDEDGVASDFVSCNEEDFEESVLGTKEFWEDNFRRDLDVYHERYEIGDIWFGQESVDRVLKWLESNKIRKNSSIIDIGCGNGATLIALAAMDYTNLYGVDYASTAVELANHIADDENQKITFEVCDFVEDGVTKDEDCQTTEKKTCLHHKYDICLDKGTYDAICLNPVERAKKKLKYQENVAKICKDDGLYIITSCNWTREELLKQFTPAFTLSDQIPTPVFHFGGKVGRRETVLVFKKNVASQIKEAETFKSISKDIENIHL